MRNLKRSLVVLVIVASIACASAQANVYKSLASTTTAVDAAMSAYGDLVRAGRVPAATQAKVKQAYEDYQIAMRLAQAAVNIWVAAGAKTPAPAEVNVAIGRAAEVQVLVAHQ